MKKRIWILLLCVMVFMMNVCSAAASVDDAKQFSTTLAKALGIKNWLSSGVNRALLAFSLGANAADDSVLGRADVLLAFMQNPTYVGKDKDSENLVAATVTEDDFVVIYFSPREYKAYVFTVANDAGVTLGGIKLESLLSSLCSDCYQIDEDDMETCIKYIQSQL